MLWYYLLISVWSCPTGLVTSAKTNKDVYKDSPVNRVKSDIMLSFWSCHWVERYENEGELMKTCETNAGTSFLSSPSLLHVHTRTSGIKLSSREELFCTIYHFRQTSSLWTTFLSLCFKRNFVCLFFPVASQKLDSFSQSVRGERAEEWSKQLYHWKSDWELVWVVASYLAAFQQWGPLNKRRETQAFDESLTTT